MSQSAEKVLCTHLLITKTFLYLFLFLAESYRSLIALILPVMFYLFCYFQYK